MSTEVDERSTPEEGVSPIPNSSESGHAEGVRGQDPQAVSSVPWLENLHDAIYRNVGATVANGKRSTLLEKELACP